MLLRSRHKLGFALLAGTLALSFRAEAGLSGFTEAHPYTYEEELLDIDVPPLHIPNYRSLMRNNLLMLIEYAKAVNPDFRIIAHQGQELLSKSLWEYHLDGYNEARRKGIDANDPSFLRSLKDRPLPAETLAGSPAYQYLNSLDAIAVNNLYCGSRRPDLSSVPKTLPLIAIDYCPDEKSWDKAIIKSIIDRHLFYGFGDAAYAFNDISHQPVINESARNVNNVADASNILILNDDSRFASPEELIKTLRSSNYDIVVMSPQFHHNRRYSPEDINSMKFKKNGTKRLLIAEMNVSEADALTYYWNRNWSVGSPAWLARPSFANQTGYITRYWKPQWQKIMSAYFKSIVDSGFDGVFFTGIENHRYFEKQTPLE